MSCHKCKWIQVDFTECKSGFGFICRRDFFTESETILLWIRNWILSIKYHL